VGKTVSTNEISSGNAPSNLVDGDNSNPWVSDYGPDGTWVQIDLEEFYDLSGVDLIHLNAWDGYGHRIDVSADAQSWSTVASMLPNERTGKVSHVFTANHIRYVRLVMVDAAFEQRVFVGELKVYGILSAGERFTVSFVANGGSEIENQSVICSHTASEPSDPAKPGYAFAGWYTDEDLQLPFDFDTAITGNITLYAKWAADSGEMDECFIATAAYGSKLQPCVVLLRQFRDQCLLVNRPGRAFVQFYYRYSPPLAHFIAHHAGLKLFVRVALLPLIGIACLMLNPPVLLLIMLTIGFIYCIRYALRQRLY
jgi:uncharacterized repeat protein (TIGR02543 family)